MDEAAFRARLAEVPDDAEALFGLGSLLLRAGRTGAAISTLRRAVAARPEHAQSRLALANALVTREPAAAMEAYAALPDVAAAQVNLSRLALSAGDAKRALFAARRAVELAPDQPAARLALARAALARCEYPMVLEATEPAPDEGDAPYLRGMALSRLARWDEARPALERALQARPDRTDALHALAHAEVTRGGFEAAAALMRRYLALVPDAAEGWLNLAYIEEQLGRGDAELAALSRAIALAPDHPRAHHNRALVRIRDGDWTGGFAEHEWRLAGGGPAGIADLPGPRWRGEPIAGRAILLRAEAGMGDTIMALRYAGPLTRAGARVSVVVQPPLASLARTVAGVAVAMDARDPGPLPAYDVWADMLSLPYLFATTPATVPGAEGYIPVPPGAAGGGIGVVWAGNPGHSADARRSLTPGAAARLLRLPARLVSLQKGPRAAEGVPSGVADTSGALTDFAATAEAVAGLDLVVTVDTAVAHLAGAMGKPVWVMLSHLGEWRWGRHGDTTPWYASMRLFRQDAPGDWDGVIDRAAAALRDAGLAG